MVKRGRVTLAGQFHSQSHTGEPLLGFAGALCKFVSLFFGNVFLYPCLEG